jgi:sugar transferase EpsL
VTHWYREYGKRWIDAAGAALLLIALGPAVALTAAIVRNRLGAPIFFRQPRPGLHGRPFPLIKFRTMTESRDERGELLPDGARLTTTGAVLRGLSADELPELWNVVRGQMSLVGPRPLLPQYLERYTPEQARRHEVRPGITGLAQVSGRNALTWEEKFALDVWYVDNCSFLLDMKILALTVWQVLARRGINQPGHATAQEFMGTSH